MSVSKQPSGNFSTRFSEFSELDNQSRKLVIPTQNLVLAGLPQSEASRIVSACKPIRVDANEALYEEGDEIEYVYFPIDCVVSSVAVLEDGSSVEISMTGREGIVGIAALVGGGYAMHWTRASVPGTALRLPSSTMAEYFHSSDAIHEAVLLCYRALFRQISQRSVCNVRHTLLQRLCVWLLMMHDRVGSSDLPFTQEDIANRISVRRAGVSVAASSLQQANTISYHRGRIVIVNRAMIESSACECYKVLNRDFGAEPAIVRRTRRSLERKKEQSRKTEFPLDQANCLSTRRLSDRLK